MKLMENPFIRLCIIILLREKRKLSFIKNSSFTQTTKQNITPDAKNDDSFGNLAKKLGLGGVFYFFLCKHIIFAVRLS